MRIELKSLQPNPFRNFKVDPIDPEVVDALKASIKENPAGFWGGIIARQTKNNGIQLAFGHHRIRAAIAAGIREVNGEVKVVPEISDAEMIRMYANENATQRGNTGTAIAGSVASATAFLLHGLFSGHLGGFPPRSKKALETLLGQAGAERGIGWDLILDFLQEIPGVNVNTVKQQLANLKASGVYDEIIETVKAAVEEEQKEQLRQLAALEEQKRKAAEAQLLAEQRAKEAEEHRKEMVKAERAAKEEAGRKRAEADAKRAEYDKEKARLEAEAAAKRKAEAEEQMKKFDALRVRRDAMDGAAGIEREITFDFEGVSKHLKSAGHIDTFRTLVTGQGIKPYLPVNRQAALAKKLVDGVGGGEVTSSYLRENIMEMVLNVRGAERRLDATEKAELLRKDWDAKARSYQDDFARQARGALAAAVQLSDHCNKRPKGVTLHVTSEFAQAVKKIESAISLMRKARII